MVEMSFGPEEEEKKEPVVVAALPPKQAAAETSSAPPPPAPTDVLPAWVGMKGVRRLAAELYALQKAMEAGLLPQVR